jgi:hypothetical protein
MDAKAEEADRALFDRIAHDYVRKDLIACCRIARELRLKQTLKPVGSRVGNSGTSAALVRLRDFLAPRGVVVVNEPQRATLESARSGGFASAWTRSTRPIRSSSRRPN